jgi:hypothetical protein
MDSRFCPEVANVLISVAQPVSLPVVGEVTNPMAAHTNYEVDPRVIDIIARGVRRGEPEDRVPEGCIWTETRETPRATAD